LLKGLTVHIDDQENIFNNEILLGKLNGFIFNPSENFEQSDDVDSFITESFIKKIDRLLNEGDAALRLSENFHLTYNDAVIAKLLPTDNIFKPDFTPILDDRIQGIALARLALHLESWLKRQLNAVCDPLDIITKTEDLSEDSIQFIQAMIEYLGYAPRYKIDAVVKKVPPQDRTKLRKAGVRFAQYGVFVRDMLKPSAQKIKLILWALKNNIPLPQLPPSGVVTIPFNADMPEGYYDIAGYKICGDYAVRADMIEKLADAIRSLALKTDTNPKGEFEITAQHMSYVGKSGDAFDAVLKSLGYNYRQEKVTIISAELIKITDSLSTELPTEASTEAHTEAHTEVTENMSQGGGDILKKTDTPQVEAETVTLKETEIEKKLWCWSPVSHKPKTDLKKPYKRFDNDKPKPKFDTPPDNGQVSDNQVKNSDNAYPKKEFKNKNFSKPKDTPQNCKDNTYNKDTKKDKKFTDKSRGNFDKNHKNADLKQDNHPSPYVNMPKTHKVAAENNPFAALLALKK
jgi:ATP-dependent RNA helicase SUPV3L1/SUV3